jgi:hypothetical protein
VKCGVEIEMEFVQCDGNPMAFFFCILSNQLTRFHLNNGLDHTFKLILILRVMFWKRHAANRNAFPICPDIEGDR